MGWVLAGFHRFGVIRNLDLGVCSLPALLGMLFVCFKVGFLGFGGFGYYDFSAYLDLGGCLGCWFTGLGVYVLVFCFV